MSLQVCGLSLIGPGSQNDIVVRLLKQPPPLYIQMKNKYFLIGLLLWSCNQTPKQPTKSNPGKEVTIHDLISNLEDSKNKEVIVVAHRGDWRHAPENSLQAIQNCIDMGVDMVEIDVRETKDGSLVLMHDVTIDRTTNASGLVKDWTLDSLKKLQLLDGLGIPTNHRIPTLEEALMLSKDKILINLDKSYSIFEKCYDVMKKTGTVDQVVIKGAISKEQVEKEFGRYLGEVYFMPIIRLQDPDAKKILNDYLSKEVPVAFEFIVPQDTFQLIERFDEIRKAGASVWVNALWPNLSAGYDDEKAALDPAVYNWYVENSVDIIQTDRPKLLVDFLREKKLHK